MSWLAVIGFALQIVTEIFKLINRKMDKDDESEKERKKQSTEAIQSGVRGLIDHDESRIRAAFDKLRELRK